MRRVVAVAVVALVALVLLYLSRFWPFELWTRQSWLGQLGLRPGGGLLAQWLRGTPFSQFELLIWVIAAFLVLSVTETLVRKIDPQGE